MSVLLSQPNLQHFDLDVPVNIECIEVSGNDRTRSEFFEAELRDAVRKPSSLRQLYPNLCFSTEKLLNMNMFDVVDTNIDISSCDSTGYKAKVKVVVKEKGIPFLKMESFVGTGTNSDLGFEIQGALRNPTGRGEVFKLATSTNQKGSKNFVLSCNIPNIDENRGKLDITARTGQEHNSQFIGYKQDITSLTVEYGTLDGKHKIIGDYSLRDEIPLNFTPIRYPHLAPNKAKDSDAKPTFASENTNDKTMFSPNLLSTVDHSQATHNASLNVYDNIAASLKSSLKYVFTCLDSRDSAANPTTGALVQGSVEVATPPGDARWVKAELTTQYHKTVGKPLFGQPGLAFSAVGGLGMLYPLYRIFGNSAANTNHANRLYLSDRYHVGGGMQLRGFDQYGIGPRAFHYTPATITNAHDSLGGDCKSNLLLTASVPVPLPSLAMNAARAFLFINAGTLGYNSYWNYNNNMRNTPQSLGEGNKFSLPVLGNVRASVGAGFSVAFSNMVRLEATYSVPVVKASQDQAKPFQLGVGLTIN